MATDLFDTVISETASERPAFRQAPPGDYLVTVQSVKFVKANSGTQGIELTYTMVEPMHDEDMEGVELPKCRLRDTQWITEKTIGYVQERLARISPEVVGNTIREVADILPGNDVVVIGFEAAELLRNEQSEPPTFGDLSVRLLREFTSLVVLADVLDADLTLHEGVDGVVPQLLFVIEAEIHEYSYLR